MPEPARLRWHEDPEAFRDLLTLTSARVGFLVRLVEEDYFCSVLLQYLAASCPSLTTSITPCTIAAIASGKRIS